MRAQWSVVVPGLFQGEWKRIIRSVLRVPSVTTILIA